jgi:hypothetical protein
MEISVNWAGVVATLSHNEVVELYNTANVHQLEKNYASR